MDNSIVDPLVPYVGAIPTDAFKPGRLIRIQATTPGVAYRIQNASACQKHLKLFRKVHIQACAEKQVFRFDINLQCGAETSPRDDIAMQISVRILDGFISINSLQNGVWGEEQRSVRQPLKRADKFEITLICHETKYKVFIGGEHFADFPQRILYECITHLTIEGDISIVQIAYDTVSSTVSSATPVLLKQTDDNFEIINTRRPTDIGFIHPPPYSEVTYGSPNSGLPPYPTHNIPLTHKPHSPDTHIVPIHISSGLSPTISKLEDDGHSSLKPEKSAPQGKVGIFVCMLSSVILGVILLTMVMFVA